MNKNLIIACAILASISAMAQTEEPQEDGMAKLSIIVTDFKGNTWGGEQILFVSDSTGVAYRGVSAKNGKFEILIPDGDTYTIQLKSVGDPETYQKLKLPKAEPGTHIGGELKIKYEPARSISLDHVYFDSNQSTLRAESYAELDELVEWLNLKPDIRIEIAGHTDDVGDDSYNLKLSQGRADAVRKYLISKGIAADRVVAKGYGETQPITSNSTDQDKQKNRRTEARIID